VAVQVVWANGLPFEGAEVEVYNYTTGALIDELETNGTGTVYFLLPAYQVYKVKVAATNPYNASQQHVSEHQFDLTEHRWLTVRLPWAPEERPERYRVVALAYNVVDGSGVPGAVVVLKKGDLVWSAETNETGYAELVVPFLGLYNATAFRDGFDAPWVSVHIYENNTVVAVPMSPAPLPVVPPFNGTAPPVYVDGTPHYWLSVRVLLQDGYPLQGANVTVYDAATDAVIASGSTDGTGAVHFLIPAGKDVRYEVRAVNPSDPADAWTAARAVTMTQHFYFVHVAPWASRFYAPEVWMQAVRVWTHRGQGYLHGPVSHLVELVIWTNRPQAVTVNVTLYDAVTNATIGSKLLALELAEGINWNWTWFEVNASQGMWVRARARIVSYEADTNPANNEAWSDAKFLKPFVDFQVFVVWRPVWQKVRHALLPEDVVEVCVGVRVPVNTTSIPARLLYGVQHLDPRRGAWNATAGEGEEVRAAAAGVIWRNFTVTVPWSHVLRVWVNVSHEWEDNWLNNAVNVTIAVDPDAKLVRVEVRGGLPGAVTEGTPIKLLLHVVSNVPEERGARITITVYDNTTARALASKAVPLKPEAAYELAVRAPENPALLFVRAPVAAHTLTATFTGYDLYEENNEEELTVTVLSWSAVWLAVALVALLMLAAAVRAIFAARAAYALAAASEWIEDGGSGGGWLEALRLGLGQLRAAATAALDRARGAPSSPPV